jgi:seryl-tRNA synthetase
MASMSLTGDQLKPLTVNQIKKVSSMMDKAIVEANKRLDDTEKERNAGLREMGNHLHPSCHVSDNEVCMSYLLFNWKSRPSLTCRRLM